MAKKSAAAEQVTFDLSRAEQSTRSDLATARDAREQLLQALAAGGDVRDQLDAIDQEIADHERQLKRFDEARKAGQKAQSKSSRRARHDRVIAKLNEGVEGLHRLSAMAQDILLTVADLQGKLAAVADERAAVSASLYDAVGEAGAPTEHEILGMYTQLQNAVNAATLPASFIDALWRSGLGRTGITLDESFVYVRPLPRDAEHEPVADAATAVARLERLAAGIERWSEQANGIKEAA